MRTGCIEISETEPVLLSRRTCPNTRRRTGAADVPRAQPENNMSPRPNPAHGRNSSGFLLGSCASFILMMPKAPLRRFSSSSYVPSSSFMAAANALYMAMYESFTSSNMESMLTSMSRCMPSTNDGPMKYSMKLVFCCRRSMVLRSTSPSFSSAPPNGLKERQGLSEVEPGRGLEALSKMVQLLAIGGEIISGAAALSPGPDGRLPLLGLERPFAAGRTRERTTTHSFPIKRHRSHLALFSADVENVHLTFR